MIECQYVSCASRKRHIYTAPEMCYEVKVFFTLCRHNRYFIIPSGTVEESPSCYMALECVNSHLSNQCFTARIRIVDTVHECTQDGCGVLGESVDYMGLLIAALTARQRGGIDRSPMFPWGVNRHIEGVQWIATDWRERN